LDELGFRIFGVCWVHNFFLLNMELAFAFVIAFVLPMVLSSYWDVKCIWLNFSVLNLNTQPIMYLHQEHPN
jgi:apolipoprotein N-acyltransferase